MDKRVRKLLRVVADYDPGYYDMFSDAEENFFAQLYVQRIVRHAQTLGIQPPAKVLEAGCQAGRLIVPFARLGFQVTGVDTSEFSLRRAKEHTRKAGVRAAFIRGDLVSVLDGRPDRQFDIIICAEVIYLWPQYRDMIKRMADSLKPGGLLCVSHRTKLYYIMEALRARDFDTAATVANSTAGPFRDSKYFNWQTAQELRQLYQSLDLNVLGIHSIDRFAWLAQMPPSGLDEAEQKQLLAIELSEAIGPDLCSRYALVVSRK